MGVGEDVGAAIEADCEAGAMGGLSVSCDSLLATDVTTELVVGLSSTLMRETAVLGLVSESRFAELRCTSDIIARRP